MSATDSPKGWIADRPQNADERWIAENKHRLSSEVGEPLPMIDCGDLSSGDWSVSFWIPPTPPNRHEWDDFKPARDV